MYYVHTLNCEEFLTSASTQTNVLQREGGKMLSTESVCKNSIMTVGAKLKTGAMQTDT